MKTIDENKMHPVVYALWMILSVIFFPLVGVYVLYVACRELAEEHALKVLDEYEKEQEDAGNFEY